MHLNEYSYHYHQLTIGNTTTESFNADNDTVITERNQKMPIGFRLTENVIQMLYALSLLTYSVTFELLHGIPG